MTEFNLASPKLEILREVYATMNKRLEHYRQLSTGVVFGTVAIFILGVGSIERWAQAVRVTKTGSVIEQLKPFTELIGVVILVTAVFVIALRMMSRASRNFKEVSSIIRKIEALFRLHEIGAFVAGDKLLPKNWSGDNEAAWVEDIIPLARGLTWTLQALLIAYAGVRVWLIMSA